MRPPLERQRGGYDQGAGIAIDVRTTVAVVGDPEALYFGDYAVDDSTLMPGVGAMLGEVRFRDWLERQLADA